MGSIEHIDKHYDQVAVPSSGGTVRFPKVEGSCDDSLGSPGRFVRNATTIATEKPDSHVQNLIDKQRGTNKDLVWDRTDES
jgi:hypothetical protein